MLVGMVAKPTLFESVDPASEAAADARAEADVVAGRVVGHEAVRRWIWSLGSDAPLARPRSV